MQSNLTLFVENDSKQSLVGMAEKGQLVSFPTSRTYCKGIYDKLQDFTGSYLVVWESMDSADRNFKNLRRIVASCEGITLYSKLTNAQKDQSSSQTILRGERRIVMLSKFGQ